MKNKKLKEREAHEAALEACLLFLKMFHGPTGRVEDGNGDIVIIVSAVISDDATAKERRRFGWTDGETAILASYRPCDESPSIKKRRAALLARHVVFPATFDGYRVLYRHVR